MRLPTLLALSAASVSALPTTDKLFKRQASSNAPDSFGLAYTTAPPTANGGAWSDAFKRAAAVTAQMTLEEKLLVVTGQNGRCVGNTGAVSRLNVPALCLQDGPTGPRPVDGHTQFPAGVTTAATWDRELIYERSRAMGQEFYDLGVHIALAPVTGGPLGRAPAGGRNWEGWYADPYATGEASYLSVKGLQDAGVQATSKHFMAYEQETSRNVYINKTAGSFPGLQLTDQLPISSNLDDTVTHETYLWSFAEAVRAGTSSVMCSYNRINGTHGCANSDALNGLLKTELNFQGFVVSDWGGVWATQPSVYGGNDLDMPGNGFAGILGIFYGDELEELVNNGTISESRLDDQVNRIFTPYFASGQADKTLPDVPFNAGFGGPPLDVEYRLVQKPSTLDLIRKIGEDGAILLKNDGGLPLKSPARIAVIGQDSGPPTRDCGPGGDSCPAGANANGTLADAGGSGYSTPLNLIYPLMAIQDRAAKDSIKVSWALNDSDIATVQATAKTADVALVFVSAWASEGYDRSNLNLTGGGDALVQAVAAVNKNTVVIMHIPGPTLVEAWIDNPNITAVLAPLLPGEQTGPSLVSVLWGSISPSGHLPFTIAKTTQDYPPNTITAKTEAETLDPQTNFTEGNYIDYKWFDAKNITPRFEFGFGLGYSTFEYSNIKKNETFAFDTLAIQKTNEKFVGQKEGESLYDVLLSVEVDVKNTGDVVACEVAQLYVEFPASANQPVRQLRGFDKVKQAAPGSTKTVSFPIRRKDVATWDVVQQKWVIATEAVTFHVGASSRILPQTITHTF
ncbi:hypothetical protein QFC21_000908 [Naganishia friedmannii]|uniref:Uncharacterized protein n=1 Tax=Naganishia friedmannii TaxID=89922 RepID=A0ACC2W6T0_9TREE|nr:hypothetical protein QFC21_000908 [Naganishia friedmannii]